MRASYSLPAFTSGSVTAQAVLVRAASILPLSRTAKATAARASTTVRMRRKALSFGFMG